MMQELEDQQADAANQSIVDQTGQLANSPLADPTKNPAIAEQLQEEPPTE